MVRHPRGTFRTVVVRAGSAHLKSELFLPVHTLRNVWNSKAILDADARMRIDQLPGQLVGTDVQPAPALRISNKAGHRHRPLEHHRQSFAFLHVFPVTGRGTAHFFAAIQLICFTDFLLGITAGRAAAGLGVLGALLTGMVAFSAETPTVGPGDLVAMLVEKVDMVCLLHRPASEPRLMFHQTLQRCFGADFVIAHYRLMPGPFGT